MSNDRRTQIRKILVEASRAKTVQEATMSDNCIPNNQMPDNKINSWFAYQTAEWKRLTQGVKVDK